MCCKWESVASRDHCVYIVHAGQKADLKDLENRFVEGKFTPFTEDAESVPLASAENVEEQPSKKKRKGKSLTVNISH